MAAAAIHAAHAVVEAHGDVPEGDVIEGAGVSIGVVGGAGCAAAGADGAGFFARLDGDFNELWERFLKRGLGRDLAFDEVDLVVNKALDRAQCAE